MGALDGVRVVELGGQGPGPYAGMLLADHGADVVVVQRPGAPGQSGALGRGKQVVTVDLKTAPEEVLALTDRADVMLEVYRPGVAERLGIGPEQVCRRNPGLVYARLSGYGQTGPYARRGGHDLTYLALSGALDLLGAAGGPPQAPLNVLADFAGGGLLASYAICAALLARHRTGAGQVLDVALSEGAALMVAPFYSGRIGGGWGPRGTNVLDGAAPFYRVYACADGGYLAVAAIEPQFYAALLATLAMTEEDPADQWDRTRWPGLGDRLAARFARQSRSAWEQLFAGVDAAVEPVLTPAEAVVHPQHVAREAFDDADGKPQPAPAPRLSATPAGPVRPTLLTLVAEVRARWDQPFTASSRLAQPLHPDPGPTV